MSTMGYSPEEKRDLEGLDDFSGMTGCNLKNDPF